MVTKKELVQRILTNQARANEAIFSEEKLMSLTTDVLTVICEASTHLIHK